MNGLRYFFSIILLIGLLAFSPAAAPLMKNSEVALASSDPVIAAAGDIACDPATSNFNAGSGTPANCRQKYTSDLLVDAGYSAVLPLGDIQYYCGGYQAFMQSYDLSWGRVKDITRPVVGNHEYIQTSDPNGPSTGCDNTNADAAGYFNYFGSAAGNPGQGYYSYDIGDWHLIALNSNCGDAGGCSPASPQGQWLQADLAAHPNVCTLAYWHIPLFSSGGRAENNSRDLWQMLYDSGVDVVLNGHDHIYERFVPQKPDGTADLVRGMRQFTVGTGGANLTFLDSLSDNSEVFHAATYGILKLTLHPTTYDWEFVPEAGKTFTDTGTGYCYGGAVQDVLPPTAPADLTASVVSADEVRLNWTAATDNTAVAGYQIFRDGTYLGSSTATSFVDRTTAAGTTYNYSVAAMDVAGLTSGPSNSVTITPVGIFNDDFESNNLSRWTTVTNLTVQPQEVFAGTYAARGVSSGLSAYAQKQLSVQQDELYYRIRFKILNQAQTTNLLKFRTAAGSSILGVFVTNTGYLGSRNDVAGVSTFSTTPVAKGVWHELQVRVLINAGAGEAEFWLDGDRVNALSKPETFGSNLVGRIQVGENASGLNFDVAFDDVTVDTHFISSGPIPTITPTFTPTNTPTASLTPSPTPTATATSTPASQSSAIFSDGFEMGNLSQWTSVQGLVVQNEEVATGSYAARGTSVAGGATYARKSLSTSQTDLYYRIGFKVISQAANTFNLLKFRTAANGAIVGVSINNIGNLSYRNDFAGKSFNSTVKVSPGSWHTLTVRVRIAGVGGQIDIWYDDLTTPVLSRTEDFGTNPIGILQLGENTPGLTYDVAFDDVLVSISENPTATSTYTPTATATITNTNTATATPTPSNTPTATLTPLDTATPTDTAAPGPTDTPTETATPLPTPTDTPAPTDTPTETATPFPTETPTSAGTATQTPTNTATPGISTLTFTPVADAYVYQSKPTNNYGQSNLLRTDGFPIMRSYLRFNIQGVSGTISRATLRVYANSASSSGYEIGNVTDNTWTESTINYNNSPAIGSSVGSSGSFSAGTWTEVDITSLVTGNGTVDLGMYTTSSTAISFMSSQSSINGPQLIVEVAP